MVNLQIATTVTIKFIFISHLYIELIVVDHQSML